MKRCIAILLAAVFAFSLTACGAQEEAKPSETNAPVNNGSHTPDAGQGEVPVSGSTDADSSHVLIAYFSVPEDVNTDQKLMALLQDMAREKSATPAQLSMAWMLCKKPWIVPIPGTRKLTRLRENAGVADVVLTASEVSALDHALDTVPMSEVFGGSRIVKKC